MSATNLPNRTCGGRSHVSLCLCASMAAIVILCVFICTSLSAMAAESAAKTGATSAAKTKEQIRAIYMAALKTEGYAPEVDKDGDIKFKKEGRTYYVAVWEETPLFVEIYIPVGLSIDKDEDLPKVYEKITEAAAKIRVVKIVLTGDKKALVFGNGFFLRKPEDFQDLFPAYLSTIESGMRALLNNK